MPFSPGFAGENGAPRLVGEIGHATSEIICHFYRICSGEPILRHRWLLSGFFSLISHVESVVGFNMSIRDSRHFGSAYLSIPLFTSNLSFIPIRDSSFATSTEVFVSLLSFTASFSSLLLSSLALSATTIYEP